MSVTLYHHPFSRAANVVWMLEEIGVAYELRFVDLPAGSHKSPELLALNPMGKLPIVTDGEAVVTESAAIGLYLADRYAPGDLAPALDDPSRATYLRWSLFAPSVIEPGSLAKMQQWEFKASNAGWGNHDDMVNAIVGAVEARHFLLGDRFSMADCIFGGTLHYMLQFKMLAPLPQLQQYVARLQDRPAWKRASERNAQVIQQHGLAHG